MTKISKGKIHVFYYNEFEWSGQLAEETMNILVKAQEIICKDIGLKEAHYGLALLYEEQPRSIPSTHATRYQEKDGTPYTVFPEVFATYGGRAWFSDYFTKVMKGKPFFSDDLLAIKDLKDEILSTQVHEMVHMMLMETIGHISPSLRWLDDGLAEFCSYYAARFIDPSVSREKLSNRLKDIAKYAPDKNRCFNLLSWGYFLNQPVHELSITAPDKQEFILGYKDSSDLQGLKESIRKAHEILNKDKEKWDKEVSIFINYYIRDWEEYLMFLEGHPDSNEIKVTDKTSIEGYAITFAMFLEIYNKDGIKPLFSFIQKLSQQDNLFYCNNKENNKIFLLYSSQVLELLNQETGEKWIQDNLNYPVNKAVKTIKEYLGK